MITLTLKESPTVPLETEAICPDVFADKSLDVIRGLPMQLGKRRHRLDDFFQVDGEPGEDIIIHGDAARVKHIGHGMTRGSITVHGNAGMHLGVRMKGGRIEVHGNVGDWLGAEMRNGFIHVHGNAGGQIGAAYRGAMAGMKEGLIIVDGNAGMEVAMRMKKGTIVIGGKVRDFAGLQMKGGTLFLLGGAEIRTGAWMTRGTIVSLVPLTLLPTFAYACSYNPTFMRIYARHLQGYGISLPFDPQSGMYQRFSGDTSVPGKGEIIVWQPHGN